MRIIGGTLRSRTLKAPDGVATRPTSDRLRETLFNVLAPRMEGAVFLDLYAGSGAVGLEAISRGAGQVVFVERAPAALKALHGNLAKLGLTTGFRVEAVSAGNFLRRTKASRFDVVFLDPPWDAEADYAATLSLLGGSSRALLGQDGIVIAEHRRKAMLEESYGTLARTRLLDQGDAALSFYAAGETGDGGE